ncbi:gentisate 1-2-dioxygenase [Apiospora rasikravindrae]|uniref:Gentisate 1-2-dioxygenase n=1 Tax=Apiospora rasikravindrae TaxID=990691 RepID=A0ABR1SIT6_9PEZI
MAEIVGLTASVIGIAELATKILATSFKLKGLLEQVSNVPEELQRHLDQIQLFSPLLATHINDDGPPALRGALRVAMIQCQQAADDLGKLAEDLHTQVHEGSRARRKVRAARIVLQKDTLVSHKKRLSSAMQMLLMACQMYGLQQQKYIIELQQQQPNLIVTQLLAGLQTPDIVPANSQSTREPVRQRGGLELSRPCVTERCGALWSQRFESYLKVGVSDLTGSLEIQYGTIDAHQEGGQDVSDLRLRIHLPRWFSSKSLDSIIRRSHAGWNYYLHTSTLHPVDSTTWQLTREIMGSKTDSLQRLKSLIAEGRISVYDTAHIDGPCQKAMMEIALESENWQICEFLAGYDVPILLYPLTYTPWYARESQSRYIQSIASHYSDDPMVFWTLLQNYDGPASYFDVIRRSVWLDCEFYDIPFMHKRLWLAALFTGDFGPVYTKIDASQRPQFLGRKEQVVRALLSRNGEVFLPNIGSHLLHYCTDYHVKGCFQSLLASLGFISLQMASMGVSGTNTWTDLLEDVVKYIVEGLTIVRFGDEPSSTGPSSRLLYSCLDDISVLNHDDYCGISSYHGTFTADSVRSIFRQYLTIISSCGVDINGFGTFMESRFMGQAPRSISVWSYKGHRRLWFKVQGILTGPEPNDWEVWFIEPTDEFVGEFWQLVDPAPLDIPGAWVDEE